MTIIARFLLRIEAVQTVAKAYIWQFQTDEAVLQLTGDPNGQPVTLDCGTGQIRLNYGCDFDVLDARWRVVHHAYAL